MARLVLSQCRGHTPLRARGRGSAIALPPPPHLAAGPRRPAAAAAIHRDWALRVSAPTRLAPVFEEDKRSSGGADEAASSPGEFNPGAPPLFAPTTPPAPIPIAPLPFPATQPSLQPPLPPPPAPAAAPAAAPDGAAVWRSTRGCGGLMRGSVTGARPPPSMVPTCIPSTPPGCKGRLIHQGAAAAKRLGLPFLPRALYDRITRLPRSRMVGPEMERRRILWKTQIIRTPSSRARRLLEHD